MRRLVALLVAVMLLGLTGQGTAMAAAPSHRTMMDCAAESAALTAPAHKKACTPADCIAMLTACAAAAAIPKTPTVAPILYETARRQWPAPAVALSGVKALPAIEPPIF